MYNASAKFKDYISRASRVISARMTIGETAYTDEDIIKLHYTNNLVPGEEFTLGTTVCAKIELSLLTSNLINELSIIKPYIGVETDTSIEEVPLGTFNIDDVKAEKDNKNIIAYDNMIKLEKAYFSNLPSLTNIQDAAEEICEKAGVVFVSELPYYPIDRIEGKTCREAIGIIAGICGGFARANRDGEIEIVQLTNTDVYITGDNYFSAPEKAEKDFVIKKITAVREDGSTISTGTGTPTEEIIYSNDYVNQTALNLILNYYNEYSYRPLRIEWQGNPAIDVGDLITVEDLDETLYVIPVMSMTLDYAGGLRSTIESVAKSDGRSEYNYKGSISTRVSRLVTEQAHVKTLLAEKATIVDLEATNARITNLQADVGSINHLLAGNITSANMATNAIQAGSAVIADGAISDAMIQNLSVNKLLAGDISTTKHRIVSDSGNMLMADNTIQISDANRVRVQIGKDASNDYNMYVWDAQGNLMFDATGLKEHGIKDKIIRDDMVSDNANINAKKLDIQSLFSEMNESSQTLKSSRILLDTVEQTLDIAFEGLKTSVDDNTKTIDNHRTSIEVMQGEISTKVSRTSIIRDINFSTEDMPISSNKVMVDHRPKWETFKGMTWGEFIYGEAN